MYINNRGFSQIIQKNIQKKIRMSPQGLVFFIRALNKSLYEKEVITMKFITNFFKKHWKKVILGAILGTAMLLLVGLRKMFKKD